MLEVRIHGRGGQGSVTFAELLAKALLNEGKQSQAFSAFGPERMGAPVRAFCRISDDPITIRSQVYEPDFVVVLDPSLMGLPEVSEGMKKGTVLMVNTPKDITSEHETVCLDATSLALRVLGRDVANTAMLGVFAKRTGIVSLPSIEKALGDRFSGEVLEKNRELVRQAYEMTGGS